MSNASDFVIENGVLKQYTGPGGDVVIPEGVTSIGDHAFQEWHSRVTSITIPDGVTSIGHFAFFGCSSLTCITIPGSVTNVGHSAFADCVSLQSVTVKSSKITFGLTVLQYCMELKTVVLEVVPSAEFNLSVFPNKAKCILPPHILQTKEILHPSLARRTKISSAEEYAYVAVYQTAKQWMDICRLAEDYAVEALPYIARLLAEEMSKMTPAKAKQLIALAMENREKVDRQAIESILSSLKEWATHAKAKAVLKIIGDCEGQVGVPQKKHPIEHYVEEKLENYNIDPYVRKVVKKGIPYADGSGVSSEKAVSLLLAEYQRRWEQTATLIQGDMGKVEVLENINLITISEVADKIAAALDHQELLALLRSLAHGANYRLYILAYTRFADEVEMELFIKEISQKLHSVAKDRYWAKNAQQAMYLSETTAAIRYIDRYGKLSQYAMMHNVDANTLRIERLYNLGMDETGRKVYDLGGKSLAVQLLPDLTLQLYDESAKKIVKSVPKAGSDESKYNAAKEDLAKLKKDIKEIRGTQFEKLFQAFLNGTGTRVMDWKRLYQSNPILRQIAGVVVWAQGSDTFTLREGKLINCAGQEYVLQECMITVAHPMEMQQDDVAAWQKYFTAHQLKQPFTQIWEPVVDLEAVKKDRYAGIEFPAYRFKGQEKHGIELWYEDHSDYYEFGLALVDCGVLVVSESVVERHTFNLQGKMQLGDFSCCKKSRAANHIIGLLDKWTVYGRIMQDDASIVNQLPQFTLAQIEKFLKRAMDNNCANCTAALLEFKNANFAGFDPMAEFTLEL